MAANNNALIFDKDQLDWLEVVIDGSAGRSTFRNLTALTWEAWVKPGANATNEQQRVWCERQSWGGTPATQHKRIRFAAVAVQGLLRFSLARNDGTSPTHYSYTSPLLFTDDQWHHIAFVAKIVDAAPANRRWTIYLDGASVASGMVVDGHATLGISDTEPKWVHVAHASADDSNHFYWDGKLDNVRLWRSERSQAEIQAGMGDHLAAPAGEANLIEEWRYNEGGAATTTEGAKNATFLANLKRNTAATSALWQADRPFMGDGAFDTTPPSSFSANAPTNISTTGFTANWNATTDNVYVQAYELTVATDTLFNNAVAGYAALNVGKVTTHEVTGLTPNTTYYYRVRALDARNNPSTWAVWGAPTAVTTLPLGDTSPPSIPASNAATSITQSSFSANWSVSTDDVAVGGYKLDVAIDSGFNNYVSGWQNIDVGNVLTRSVNTGLLAGTTYYYRVRAYDTSLNESDSSAVVTVQTSPPPDTTPPNTVDLLAASSVEHDSFTANWNEGVDNVGVTGYRLDVAQDANFTTPLSGYNNLNVGNVTSYAVEGPAVLPNTSYYYRVRAYDAAGNVSTSPSVPQAVTTRAVLAGESAPYVVVYEPIEDAEVREAAATSNFGSASSMTSDGTASAKKRMLLKFNVTGAVGTITNAVLNLFVTEPSAASHSVQVATGAWDEDTVTWNTQPTLTGSILTLNPLVDENWVALDVASLIGVGGEVTLVVFHGSSTDAFTADTKEGTNRPHLDVTIDPQTATQIETVSITSEPATRTNWLKNPSAEAAFGVGSGVESSGSTVTQVTDFFYHGTKAAKCVQPSGGSFPGLVFKSDTGLNLTGSTRYFNGAIFLRASTTISNLKLLVRAQYTDATYSDSNQPIITVGTQWQRYAIDSAVTLNPAKTLDRFEFFVFQDTGVAESFWADAALVEEVASVSEQVGGYFDGATLGATWDTTANASKSTFQAPQLSYLATYVGDGDEDNSATLDYKRSADTSFVQHANITASVDHETKRITGTIGPSYNSANLIENPSFEVGTDFWTAVGGGASISRVMTEAKVGNAALAVVVPASAFTGCQYLDANQRRIAASPGEVVRFRAWAKLPVGMSVDVGLFPFDSSGVQLAGAVSSAFTADGTWHEQTVSHTMPANTAYVVPRIAQTATAPVSGTFYVDAAGVNKGTVLWPYLDGDMAEGRWAGIAHKSQTWRTIAWQTAYDVRVTVTDPDGVFGTNPRSTIHTTGVAPTNTLTTSALTLTAQNEVISVAATYTGDDNGTSEALIEWKRADLSTWSRSTTVYDRPAKTARATLSGLNPGTAYDVRVTFLDAVVYGANPLTGQVLTTITGINPGTQPRISFGGFVLQGPTDLPYWVSEHDGLSHPDRRLSLQDLSRQDGAVETLDLWGTRTIRLRGGVSATDRADLDGKVQALRAAFAKAQQRLVIDTLAETNRFFTATCRSLGVREVAGETFIHLLWDAEFVCADPFRYEAAETVEQEITLAHNGTLAVVNEGDLSAEPIVTITTGSAVPVTIQFSNTTTGERIIPDVTIVVNDVLVINTQTLSVTKNGVEVDFAGGFPRLLAGSNLLKVALSPTAATVTVTVRRRHRYL